MALDVFPPRRATAGLGSDGHPQRRAEMSAFPQRMWVGGRVHSARSLSIGEPAERSSRLRSAELKEGSTGRFWLVTVEHSITQGGEVCIEEEQDLVLREPAAVVAPGPDVDETPPPTGSRRAPQIPSCSSATRPSRSTRTGFTTTSRTPRAWRGIPIWLSKAR